MNPILQPLLIFQRTRTCSFFGSFDFSSWMDDSFHGQKSIFWGVWKTHATQGSS